MTPGQEARWLDPAVSEAAQLADILAPYADDQLAIHRVSKAVNSARNNNRQMVEAVDE